MNGLAAVDAEKGENLIEEIKDLRERIDQLERYALTSQNIKANKIAVGNIALVDVIDGVVHSSEGLYAGPGATGYASVSVMPATGSVGDFIFFKNGLIAGLLRVDENDDLVWQRYNPPGTFVATGLTLDSSTGDIYSVPLTDYSGLSTIVGWGSYENKFLQYRTDGKMVDVLFYIQGTSDDAGTSFTVPFANGLDSWITATLSTRNNGTFSIGHMYLGTGSKLCTFYSNPAAAGWLASGIKRVAGQFRYQAA